MQPALLIASIFLPFAAYWSLRLSYADWLFRVNTPASVARAAALDPSNSRYQAWLAEQLENEGHDSTGALDTAVRLNPFDSRVWIRRGLNAELTGNLPEAERLLLHAASIDRLMEPRWTLMNFYFRRTDSPQFWRWAKDSFAISYGDRTPLLDLCWRMKPDPTQIEAATHSYPIRKQFLEFLLAKQQFTEAAALATRILADAPPADRAVFYECVNRLIEHRNADQAVKLWNSLEPANTLDPERGPSLTNPGFAQFPSSSGFDWRLPSDPQLTAIKTPAGLRVTLTGKQPGSCRLLSQTFPVKPGRTYRLRFSYLTSGIAGVSGIRAHVAHESSPDLASDQPRDQSITFHSGPQSLATLAFEYHRVPGYIPTEGSLTLKDFKLDPLE